MDKKGKGDMGKGEARDYSANQSVTKPRIPYVQGLSSTTIIFEKLGKLEKITRVNENKITLKINFSGPVALVDYRGKIPRKCRGHLIYLYEEIRAGKSRRIQVWDQTTGIHYYSTFR